MARIFLTLPFLLLLSTHAFAEEMSCPVSGPIVGYVNKGDITVLLSCPDPIGANPYPCTCHEPAADKTKCRVYACNANAEGNGPVTEEDALPALHVDQKDVFTSSPAPGTGNVAPPANDTLAPLEAKAKAGDAEAQYQLAMALVKIKADPQNYGRAMLLWQSSAEKGYAPAQFMMGAQYVIGDAGGHIPGMTHAIARTEGFKWFAKGAAQGDAQSAFMLGQMYEEGAAGPKNPVEAYFWCSFAAMTTAVGKTPPPDDMKGIYATHDAMARAAESIAKTLTPSQIASAQSRVLSWKPGMPPAEPVAAPVEPSKAELAKQAADKKAEEKKAAAEAARLAVEKKAEEKKKAAEDKKRAAEAAIEEKRQKEEARLEAIEAEKETKEREEAAKKQAEEDAKELQDIENRAYRGDMEAQSLMGLIYIRGNGKPQPVAANITAAGDDELRAGEFRMAPRPREGVAHEQDFDKGVMWYKRAANQGDLEAMYNLGCLYRYGRGIHQDLEEAYFWFSLASARYSSLGNVQMYIDDPKLSPAQIEAVKKRVSEWKPSVYKPPIEEKH